MTVNLDEGDWFKSSHSTANGECVEVAFLTEGMVGIRDSKNLSGPALVFAPREWDSFTTDVASGKFSRPSA
ncbi:DUF397 domain-containing protein [Nocardia sp. NPDC049707]|uniref:DUF397 domain-containing protein n=1 Tax=Nocardia sp. NPDC049707 TaxID=3154735 RepID=UPI0034227A0A